MRARLLLSIVLALSPSLGLAQDQLTITNNNSSLKVTRDPATFVGFGPSDPLRLPRTMEWTVDGRTILVYPSAPWDFIDVEHFHTDAHVGVQQLHAQGPMLGLEMLAMMTDMARAMPTLACEALAKLKLPKLLVTGERSPAGLLLITAELEYCMEGESHVMVPDAGHGMHSANPTFYNGAVLAFLQRARGSAR